EPHAHQLLKAVRLRLGGLLVDLSERPADLADLLGDGRGRVVQGSGLLKLEWHRIGGPLVARDEQPLARGVRASVAHLGVKFVGGYSALHLYRRDALPADGTFGRDSREAAPSLCSEELGNKLPVGEHGARAGIHWKGRSGYE